MSVPRFVPAMTPSGIAISIAISIATDREFDRGWIAFENQFDDRTIVAKRQTHVATEQRTPVIGVAIVDAVPDEMSLIVVVAWKREEERRPIETVLLAKLCKLFRRRLLAEHGNSRITGNEFD